MNSNLSGQLKNPTVIPMNFDDGVPARKKGSAFTVCPVLLESQNEKSTIPNDLSSDEVPKKKISVFTIYPQSIDEQQTICSTYPHHVHFEDKVIVFVPESDPDLESAEPTIEKTKSSSKMWRCSLTIAAPIIIFLACFLIFFLAVLVHHH